jgi:hypothetical protein
MLDKKVCIHCRSTHNQYGQLWGEDAEYKWEVRSYVVCPEELSQNYNVGKACVGDEPPEWCPYTVEHTVS